MTAIAGTLSISLRQARSTAAELRLEVGQAIHYQGLGAGQVVTLEEREFKGEPCTFAVIEFPHRALRAHIPLGTAGSAYKLRPVISAATARELLEVIDQPGQPLDRIWQDRDKDGRRRLREGRPFELAELLRDFASADRDGMSLLGSDHELMMEIKGFLAAEYAFATDTPFTEARELIAEAYTSATVR